MPPPRWLGSASRWPTGNRDPWATTLTRSVSGRCRRNRHRRESRLWEYSCTRAGYIHANASATPSTIAPAIIMGALGGGGQARRLGRPRSRPPPLLQFRESDTTRSAGAGLAAARMAPGSPRPAWRRARRGPHGGGPRSGLGADGASATGTRSPRGAWANRPLGGPATGSGEFAPRSGHRGRVGVLGGPRGLAADVDELGGGEGRRRGEVVAGHGRGSWAARTSCSARGAMEDVDQAATAPASGRRRPSVILWTGRGRRHGSAVRSAPSVVPSPERVARILVDRVLPLPGAGPGR